MEAQRLNKVHAMQTKGYKWRPFAAFSRHSHPMAVPRAPNERQLATSDHETSFAIMRSLPELANDGEVASFLVTLVSLLFSRR